MYNTYATIYHRIRQGAWSERMVNWTLDWLHRQGTTTGHVIDWGCGDGAAAARFATHGWQVTGIDRSPAMLRLAQQRTAAVEWRAGDLRETQLEQPGTLATAFYDTLNYLVSIDELQTGWRTLAHSITTGGYVFADVNTPYEYATTWRGQHIITADTDDVLVMNRLRYNTATQIARGRVTWFARDSDGATWRRGSELHLQRAHTDVEMLSAIEQAGLTLVDRGTLHGESPSPTATRVIYIARKDELDAP